MAPTEQPIPLPQPMHTENSQRVFHSHSLPLQFYFCSSLIYINDFFFSDRIFHSHFASRLVSICVLEFFFCFLLLFATIVLVPHVRQICALFLFCVYAVLTIIFFRRRRHRHRVRLFVFYVSCAAVLSIWLCIYVPHMLVWYGFRCKTSVE